MMMGMMRIMMSRRPHHDPQGKLARARAHTGPHARAAERARRARARARDRAEGGGHTSVAPTPDISDAEARVFGGVGADVAYKEWDGRTRLIV